MANIYIVSMLETLEDSASCFIYHGDITTIGMTTNEANVGGLLEEAAVNNLMGIYEYVIVEVIPDQQPLKCIQQELYHWSGTEFKQCDKPEFFSAVNQIYALTGD